MSSDYTPAFYTGGGGGGGGITLGPNSDGVLELTSGVLDLVNPPNQAQGLVLTDSGNNISVSGALNLGAGMYVQFGDGSAIYDNGTDVSSHPQLGVSYDLLVEGSINTDSSAIFSDGSGNLTTNSLYTSTLYGTGSGTPWANPASRIIYDQYSEPAFSSVSDTWNTDEQTTIIADPDYGYAAINGSLFVRNSLQMQTFGGSTTTQFNPDGSCDSANGYLGWDGSGNLTALSFTGDGSGLTGVTDSSALHGSDIGSSVQAWSGTLDSLSSEVSFSGSDIEFPAGVYASNGFYGDGSNLININASTTSNSFDTFFEGNALNTSNSITTSNGVFANSFTSNGYEVVDASGNLVSILASGSLLLSGGAGHPITAGASGGTPTNLVTPAGWMAIQDATLGTCYLPLYQ